MCASVLRVPFSLGAIQKVLDRVAQAIEPHYTATAMPARQAPVNYINATPWFLTNTLQWLWVMASERVALYMIHPHRWGGRGAAGPEYGLLCLLPAAAPGLGAPAPAADRIVRAALCRGREPAGPWGRCPGAVPALGGLCTQNPARGKAHRPAHQAGGQISVGGQSADCPDLRDNTSLDILVLGRRGDPLSRDDRRPQGIPVIACLWSYATSRSWCGKSLPVCLIPPAL